MFSLPVINASKSSIICQFLQLQKQSLAVIIIPMNDIKCSKCGNIIPISEVAKQQLNELRDEQLATIRKEEREKAVKKIEEEHEIEFKDLHFQLEEKNKKIDEFKNKELELREEKRKLEDSKKDFELEMARKMDDQRKKISEEENEKHQIREKEQEEVIQKLKSDLAEALRKAPNISQQTQGESLETFLEENLKKMFPNDDISSVGKGVKGADILQNVKNSQGKSAGKILWETKRATWSPSWLPKIREDSREAGATLSVLVSENLPKDTSNFRFMEGIIVSSIHYAIPLAGILRINMMQIAAAKSTAANKDQKLEMLYVFLQSDTFRHRFEAYAEGIVEMQNDLNTEIRSMQRLWKKRGLQIQKSLDNISNLWGELQGIVGSSSLPDIKILSLPGENNEKEQETLV